MTLISGVFLKRHTSHVGGDVNHYTSYPNQSNRGEVCKLTDTAMGAI